MSETPNGWMSCKLNDVIEDLRPGFASGKKDLRNGLMHLRMNNISVDGKLNLELVRTVPNNLGSKKHYLMKGDVLICTTNSGKLVGKCALFDQEGVFAFSNHLTRLRPNGLVDSKYLSYQLWLLWREGAFEHACRHWVNQSTLPKAELLSTDFVLAPLNEQRRIVAKLEKVLSRVDAAKERLATIPLILKRFRQSVLAAACSGELTVDWRKENTNSETSSDFIQRVQAQRLKLLILNGSKPNKRLTVCEVDFDDLIEVPEEWSWATVDQLSTKVVDGVHRKPHYVERGIPFLTVRNLTAGPGISFERTSFITESDHREFIKRANPEKGDILISKDGTLGVVRLIDTEKVFSIFVSLAMIKPVYRTLGPYLALAISAPQVQQRIVVTGTGLQHIHLRDLRAVPVPIPPEHEQQEIVRRVEALFKTADALEARYQKAKAHVDKLTQSILAKAFRGELVPQDPIDESASVLLERIREAQNGLPSKMHSPREKRSHR